jgi:hypothetical protein
MFQKIQINVNRVKAFTPKTHINYNFNILGNDEDIFLPQRSTNTVTRKFRTGWSVEVVPPKLVDVYVEQVIQRIKSQRFKRR